MIANSKLLKRLLVIMMAISVTSGSVLAGAKTKTVNLNEGEYYKLPVKAHSIVVKNKKVVKLIKKRKLKACKAGSCKVTYTKKGKKYKVNLVVKKEQRSEIPAATPVLTPIATPVLTPIPACNPTSEPIMWGGWVDETIFNCIITKMEDVDDTKVEVCLEWLGDEYANGKTSGGKVLSKLRVEKVQCIVAASFKEEFKVGDYANVIYTNSYKHKPIITVEGDTTIISGVPTYLEKCIPVKKSDVTPSPQHTQEPITLYPTATPCVKE